MASISTGKDSGKGKNGKMNEAIRDLNAKRVSLGSKPVVDNS